jgi:hypothetical protein
MRWFKTTVIVLIVFFVVSIVGVGVFLHFNGRTVFIERVGSLTNRKVSLGAVRLALPLGLELDGLVIEGLLITSKARVYVDPWPLFWGQLTFSSARLETPAFFVERGINAALALPSPDSPAQTGAGTPVTAPRPKDNPRPVVLKELVVENGVLYLSDEKTQRIWTIDKINGVVDNIPLTGSMMRTRLFVTASLARLDAPFIGQALKAKGWVNWAARDMDVVAQTANDAGQTGLNVRLVSKANDLLVDGRARLSGSRAREARGKDTGTVESAALGILSALAADIDVGFSFHTQMDRIDIGKVALSGNVATDLSPGDSSGHIVSDLKAVGEDLMKQGEAEKKP